MQKTLNCKHYILSAGHESHGGENLCDFIMTSVERKLTIIGSLRSGLIHWAASQAGGERSEFLVQNYYTGPSHAARSFRLRLFRKSESVGERKYSIFKNYTHNRWQGECELVEFDKTHVPT